MELRGSQEDNKEKAQSDDEVENQEDNWSGDRSGKLKP